MQPQRSPHTLTEWSGAQHLVQKWLARRCGSESIINLLGGVIFLIFGLVALVFTSVFTAGLVALLMIELNAFLSVFGLKFALWRPVQFTVLFIFFLLLSVVHAYRTRWKNESAAQVDLSTAFGSVFSLGWEFLSAGPILLILSIQDFHRYVRLARLDVPHVSAVLLWLYDQGGRAGFAEISLAFPALNAVRVLPQLRDLPGIHWWPGDGEISMSDTLQKNFAELLGRKPKTSPFFHQNQQQHHRNSYERRQNPPPVVETDAPIHAWYAALNLPLFAPLQQVKARYRKLAKIHHPDTRTAHAARGQKPDDEQMKRINEAYRNILKHTHRQAGAPG